MSTRRKIAIVIGALSAPTLALGAAFAAGAAERPPLASFAEGRFVDATLLGASASGVVTLDPATARNDGSTAVEQEVNPLSVTALGSVEASPGTTVVGDVDGAGIGVVGQFAVARNDGTSFASSGTIGSDGAISVSPTQSGSARIDLGAAAGERLPAGIAGLWLEVEGIAASAQADLDQVDGGYMLADARLVLRMPAVADLPAEAATEFVALDAAAEALGGPRGEIAVALADALRTAGLDLELLSDDATVDIDVQTRIDAFVAGIGDTVLSDPAITIDLATGDVRVDLAALPSSTGLNDLEPGTELLSAAVLGDISRGIDRLLEGYLAELRIELRDILEDAAVSVDAAVSATEHLQTGETESVVVREVRELIDPVTGRVLGGVPGASGLLGTVGTAVPPVERILTQFDTVVLPVYSSFESSADVVVRATIGDLADGAAATATADAAVLGVPTDLDVAVLLPPVAERIDAALFGPGGAMDLASDGLAEAFAGAIGTDEAGIAGVVSLQANVQRIDGGSGEFTQTALRAEVLGGTVATIDLANATVGPNGAPGTPGTPGTPGVVPPGGDPGEPPTAGAETAAESGTLAYTGGALPLLLVALAVLLLGAGAWLWRLGSGVGRDTPVG